MVITPDEREIINVMMEKYRKHVLYTYSQENKVESFSHIENLDEILADALLDIDAFKEGKKTLSEIKLGILLAMKSVLDKFDITDTQQPMYTIRDKIDDAINSRIILGLN